VRFSLVAGATLVLVLAAACGGTPGTTPARSTAPGATTAASAATGCTGGIGLPVGIANFAFNPPNITVAVGGAVTWANADTTPHTVTFDEGPDCGQMTTGGTVSRTFDAAGTFAYHCEIHPTAMRGTVVVQ